MWAGNVEPANMAEKSFVLAPPEPLSFYLQHKGIRVPTCCPVRLIWTLKTP